MGNSKNENIIWIDKKRILFGGILGTLSFVLLSSKGLLKIGIMFWFLFLFMSIILYKCSSKNIKLCNMFIGIFSTIATVYLTQLLLNESMIALGVEKIILGALICGIFILLIYCITLNCRIAIVCSMFFSMVWTSANYFVYMFRGSEFIPADIFSLKTALNVVEEYKFEVNNPFLYAWILFLVFVFGYFGITNFKSENIIKDRFFVSGLLLMIIFIVGFTSRYLTPLHFLQSGSVENGYMLNFVLQLRETFVKRPSNYDVRNINDIAFKLNKVNNVRKTEYPDIFIIMDESFANLSVLGNEIVTNKEVMPFYNSLEENVIKGYALSSVIGGGTPNSEYEFLSGNTMAFLPQGSIVYQQYINDDTYSMISYLSNLGYYCSATHPYLSSGWKRTHVYEDLGFDEISFLDSYPQKKLLRTYVSDQEMFEQIMSSYENRIQSGKENQMTFGVTMQNHGGYDYNEIDFESQILLNGYKNKYYDAEQYLTLIHETDKALGYLVNRLSEIERPVVLVFFGDHLPSLSTEFCEEIHGGKFNTLDEQILRYKIPFMIWTNYDIDEKYMECTSLNYLSTYLYKTAGIPLPKYNEFLTEVEKKIPAINSQGYYSYTAQSFLPIAEAEGEEKDILNLYNQLEYNCLFDNKNRNNNLFPIRNKE